MNTPTPDRAPDDEQPSAEARTEAIQALQVDMWDNGDPPTLEDAIHSVALALDRFRAAGVRELQAAINTILEDPILDDEARLADIAEIVTDWSGLERGEMQ